MTIAQQAKRIHPLVAVAATSVTLFSLLGIAAITGVLPTSRGESPEPVTSEAPRDLPAQQQSAMQNGTAQQPVAQAKNNPNANASAKKAQPVVAQQTTEPITATQPPVVAQQKPAAQNSPVGIGVGAVIGGVIGNQMGSGDGKTLATIAGAIGGGYLGNEIAKNAKP